MWEHWTDTGVTDVVIEDVGTVNNRPCLIHVDGDVLKFIRENPRKKKPPIMRVLLPYKAVSHYDDNGQPDEWEQIWFEFQCDWVEIHGPSWAATTWTDPMPDRPNAICVVKTFSRVTIGLGSRKKRSADVQSVYKAREGQGDGGRANSSANRRSGARRQSDPVAH